MPSKLSFLTLGRRVCSGNLVSADLIVQNTVRGEQGSPGMPTPQYGDYQSEIYGGGLQGNLPRFPVDFDSLERAAIEVLPPWIYSYVGYGAGDGNTQRANVEAFSRYGIV